MASGKIMTLKAAILAALAGAAGSGLLVADAAAKVSRRDDEGETAPPLLLAPQVDASALLAHRSHSSHRSHQSHRSHSSGGRGSHYSAPSYSGKSYSGKSYSGSSSSGSSSSGKSYSGSSSSSKLYSDDSSRPAKPAKAVPPKPAKVSLVALPGGSIFVDGKLVGRDETPRLTLKVGKHTVKVENRFLGTHEHVITVSAGQSGRVKVEW